MPELCPHAGAALAKVQALPHAWQFDGVSRSVSHPFEAASPSQLPHSDE